MDRSETGGMSSGVGQVSATAAGSQHSEDTAEGGMNEKGTEEMNISAKLSKRAGRVLIAAGKAAATKVLAYLSNKPAQEFELVCREEDDARRILLIGLAGRGKSATGNSILGQDVFTVSDGSEPTRDPWTSKSSEPFGGPITVYDGLSIPDERMARHELQTRLKASLKECFEKCNDGFDCLVFVVSYNCRITRGEQVAAETIKKMLGDISSDHFVLIFTHGESFDLHQTKGGGKSFEEWRQDILCPIARELVHNFGDKVFLFYNESKENENDSSDNGKNESKMLSSSRKFHDLLAKIPGRIQMKSLAGNDELQRENSNCS